MLTRRQFSGSLAAPFLAATEVLAQPLTQVGKTVRLVVPFAPGQGSDILARAMAQQLALRWNQPVTVENKPGANGSIAATEVARASGDGHTILVTSNSPIVINPNLYKKLTYDPVTELTAIKLMGLADLAILVGTQSPAKTLPDLIALLKSRPGKLSFGSPGVGSTSHMATQLLMQLTGTDMVHVPYKGSSQAMTDLIGGQIDVMIDALPSSLTMAKNGRVRMLALTGNRASIFAPDVPTAASLGINGLPFGGWYGVFVPATTPTPVSARISTDLTTVMQSSDIIQRLKDQFIEPVPSSMTIPFAEFVRNEIAFWEKTARSLNLYRTE